MSQTEGRPAKLDRQRGSRAKKLKLSHTAEARYIDEALAEFGIDPSDEDIMLVWVRSNLDRPRPTWPA